MESPNRTIVFCSDTWHPQMNGAVRTLQKTIEVLEKWGYGIELIQPFDFPHFPLPMNHDIEVVYWISPKVLRKALTTKRPRAIIVVNEAPIGLAARAYCRLKGLPYSTLYLTDWPDVLNKLVRFPKFITRVVAHWFHGRSASVLTVTPTMADKLSGMGIKAPIAIWPGGVDTNLFRPREKQPRDRKVVMYVGRVAKEKGIEEFLECKGDYDKVIVGDGHARPGLEKRYPDAKFVGCKFGEELAATYATADVFAFPSRTDTFGLVLLEALACGVPCAAFPVQGPIDILSRDGKTIEGVGSLNANLEAAIQCALDSGDPVKCRELALEYSWERQTEKLLANLTFIDV